MTNNPPSLNTFVLMTSLHFIFADQHMVLSINFQSLPSKVCPAEFAQFINDFFKEYDVHQKTCMYLLLDPEAVSSHLELYHIIQKSKHYMGIIRTTNRLNHTFDLLRISHNPGRLVAVVVPNTSRSTIKAVKFVSKFGLQYEE